MEILFDRNRLPGFEIHIVLLAFADFDGHRIEAGENLRQHLGRVFAQQAVGADEHRIARQDGDVLSPFGEDGRVTPAHRRVVHDVVVQQREIMENLDGCRCRHGRLGLVGEDSAGKHQQHGTQPFPAHREGIADRCVQPAGFFGISDLSQIMFDGFQNLVVVLHAEIRWVRIVELRRHFLCPA